MTKIQQRKSIEVVVPLTACLYLAAKVNEYELAKIRDIINVVQFTLNS